jgi:hypothetical protein
MNGSVDGVKMEMNRRVFLGVLGATAAVAAAKGTRCPAPPPASVAMPGGLCFFAEARREPAARPRTTAITYLPIET